MRRALLLCAVLACARHPSAADPLAWIELQTEHFTLRTDLAEPEAREVAAQLELVRAALIATSWHNAAPIPGRLQVIDLAAKSELQKFAAEGIDGFVTADAFGERMLVMSADQPPEELTVLKHEMAHVISNEFLVRNPRWLAEGIACYLETMHFDRAAHKVSVGDPGPGQAKGQGIKTAVIQVAAEELSVEPSAINLVTADTSRTPNEGYTAGSQSMQDSATAIRHAAAQAREILINAAASRLGTSADRLSVRWYIGYNLDEPLPDHSSLTRIRERYGVELFQRFFEAIVDQCQQAGLVWGKELYVDATKVQANASMESVKPRFAVETHLANLFAAEPAEEAQQVATQDKPASSEPSPQEVMAAPVELHTALSAEQRAVLTGPLPRVRGHVIRESELFQVLL